MAMTFAKALCMLVHFVIPYIMFISRHVAEQMFITSGQMQRVLLTLSITQHILQVHIMNFTDSLCYFVELYSSDLLLIMCNI